MLSRCQPWMDGWMLHTVQVGKMVSLAFVTKDEERYPRKGRGEGGTLLDFFTQSANSEEKFPLRVRGADIPEAAEVKELFPTFGPKSAEDEQ